MPSYRTSATVAGLAFALALGGVQVSAQAVENGAVATGLTSSVSAPAAASFDKASFYAPDTDAEGASLQAVASISPRKLSDEMKYFSTYESSGNYRQGFGPGDGYNAVGYYQFDRRYGLIDFMQACVAYNPRAYAMFNAVIARGDEVKASGSVMAYRDDSTGTPVRVYTELGRLVEDAWFAAYDQNPEEFSALQDDWAYQEYYEPIQTWLANYGLDISGRADCVKGLFWGATNLFGAGGRLSSTYKYKVDTNGNGSLADEEYRDSGISYNGVKFFIVGSGVNAQMTDEELVRTFADYIVNNVSVYCYGQAQYWTGWQNRYRNEKADCLAFLEAAGNGGSSGGNGSTGGNGGSAGGGSTDGGSGGGSGSGSNGGSNGSGGGTQSPDNGGTQTPSSRVFDDVDYAGGAWYVKGVNFVSAKGLMNGYGGSNSFGVGKPLKRGELAVVLFNNAVSNGTDKSLYSSEYNMTNLDDLKGGQFYTQAANWAVRTGVINGSSNPDGSRTFDADGTVTFEMLITVLANYSASKSELIAAGQGSLDQFADGAQTSFWAKSSMVWAVNKGLVNGSVENGGTYLHSGGQAMRERVAAVLLNAFDKGVLK